MAHIHITGPLTVEGWVPDPARGAIVGVVCRSLILFVSGVLIGWGWGMRYAVDIVTGGR